LKAGTGDSILIHHQNHNILIDGGNDSKYLLTEIDEIYKKKQNVDLLIITHHDDDHIKGIIDVLKHIKDGNYDGEHTFIKQIIFNSPRLILNKIDSGDEKLLSYKQAFDVEKLLKNTKAKWEKYNDESLPLVYGDLTISFLSPDEKDLKEYSEGKGAYLTSDFKCDWDAPMAVLERYISDDSQDTSIPNKSSVVVQIACENRKILLTGDVTPGRLQIILNKLVENNEGNPMAFDYVKLPHHGSYRSLNKSIIEKINCYNFIISTNSKKHFLPNKRALLKIVKFLPRDKRPVNFIFNYDEALSKLEITDREQKEYNFKLTGNNRPYGISI